MITGVNWSGGWHSSPEDRHHTSSTRGPSTWTSVWHVCGATLHGHVFRPSGSVTVTSYGFDGVSRGYTCVTRSGPVRRSTVCDVDGATLHGQVVRPSGNVTDTSCGFDGVSRGYTYVTRSGPVRRSSVCDVPSPKSMKCRPVWWMFTPNVTANGSPVGFIVA